jgi:hypothetical protein
MCDVCYWTPSRTCRRVRFCTAIGAKPTSAGELHRTDLCVHALIQVRTGLRKKSATNWLNLSA